MQQSGKLTALQKYKSLGSFLVFTVIAIALYIHIGKFWHLSTNFSLLNFSKTQGSIIEVNNTQSKPYYTIGYNHLTKQDTVKLTHDNYFTDHYEKGDTLSVYISEHAVRVPKVDRIDHYIWFLLFCFGVCAYIAAISLRKHLFKS